MATVKFTSNLKRFYPELVPLKVQGGTVASALSEVEAKFAGIKGYILDDNGRVREHVNLYIGGDLITDRETLSDKLSAGDELYIMQAISGG
ncbi:MoaD/ThiS family protein [Roseivirga misakiensis]|uniref:Molybdenum cofactor biosynthesis protein MoaD n=1 Tax=Roseivirga misakiensis TaxID=1563681 RepID=A0A1E5SZK8_9BACT|nr:MoaD/ThiS family protein [Roseivirga misakiensis]OEK04568.1 molybdenum cofactor biosynthesis protein MoaD [Roseivirga misakiensis]